MPETIIDLNNLKRYKYRSDEELLLSIEPFAEKVSFTLEEGTFNGAGEKSSTDTFARTTYKISLNKDEALFILPNTGYVVLACIYNGNSLLSRTFYQEKLFAFISDGTKDLNIAFGTFTSNPVDISTIQNNFKIIKVSLKYFFEKMFNQLAITKDADISISIDGKLYDYRYNSYETVSGGYVRTIIIDHKSIYKITSSFTGGVDYACISYFDNENQYISSEVIAKSFDLVDYEPNIPSNAYTMVVNGRYVIPTIKKVDFIGSVNNLSLNPLIGTRSAVINFQFDDGDVKDAYIYNIFHNKNAVCGFALISTISQQSTRVSEYLGYQNDGFEILSHSTDSTPASNETSSSEIEEKMRLSKATLKSLGFKIRGWVTPSSQMPESFRGFLRKYYDFAYTVYLGQYTDITTDPSNSIIQSEYDMKRVSLQTTTLANQKLAVDKAIEQGGMLTFYGHSVNLDGTDYLTTSNLNELIDYIKQKQSNGYCYLMKPSDCYDEYYKVRHDDIVKIISD